MLRRSLGTPPSGRSANSGRWGLDPLSDYLPAYPGESANEYSLRRARTVLYNGYGYTVSYIAGKILSRPVALSLDALPGNLASALSELSSNVDAEGQDITAFAWQLVPEAIDSGVTYIFVDWIGDTRGKTQEVASSEGARARLIHVPPSAIVKIRSRKSYGRPEVARLQVLEEDEDEVDQWTEESVRRVRVYYAAGEARTDGTVSSVLSWELWRIPGEGEPFIEVPPTDAPPLTFIPVVPFYTRRCGFMEGMPALEDQAWLQLSHYRKRSNLDNILDVANVPTLERVGINEAESKQNQLGVYRFFWSSNKDAQTRWVELKGDGVRLLMEDVTNLEARIMLLGMQPMVAKPSGGLVTATERLLDEENAMSQLEAWALSLQDSLELAFRYVANWYGVSDLPENIVSVQADLTFDVHGKEGSEFIRWMRDRGDLSAEGLYAQAKMRGLLPDRYDGQAEQRAIAEERRRGLLVSKALMTLGGGGEAEDGSAPEDGPRAS